MALILFTISAIGFFIFNFYQDFKSRSIYVVNLPIAIVLIAIYSFVFHPQLFQISSLLINLLILGIQFVVLYLYLLLSKKDRSISLTNYIAIADILFLLLPIFYFNPIIYILFEIVVLLISILITRIFEVIVNKSRNESVPLAGYIGLGLAVVIGIESLTTFRINDPFILNKLMLFY